MRHEQTLRSFVSHLNVTAKKQRLNGATSASQEKKNGKANNDDGSGGDKAPSKTAEDVARSPMTVADIRREDDRRNGNIGVKPSEDAGAPSDDPNASSHMLRGFLSSFSCDGALCTLPSLDALPATAPRTCYDNKGKNGAMGDCVEGRKHRGIQDNSGQAANKARHRNHACSPLSKLVLRSVLSQGNPYPPCTSDKAKGKKKLQKRLRSAELARAAASAAASAAMEDEGAAGVAARMESPLHFSSSAKEDHRQHEDVARAPHVINANIARSMHSLLRSRLGSYASRLIAKSIRNHRGAITNDARRVLSHDLGRKVGFLQDDVEYYERGYSKMGAEVLGCTTSFNVPKDVNPSVKSLQVERAEDGVSSEGEDDAGAGSLPLNKDDNNTELSLATKEDGDCKLKLISRAARKILTERDRKGQEAVVREVSLPVTFAAIVDVIIGGDGALDGGEAKVGLQFGSSGSIVGTFHGPSANCLLESVEIDLDVHSLVRSMMDQARGALRTAIMKAIKARLPPTPNMQVSVGCSQGQINASHRSSSLLCSRRSSLGSALSVANNENGAPSRRRSSLCSALSITTDERVDDDNAQIRPTLVSAGSSGGSLASMSSATAKRRQNSANSLMMMKCPKAARAEQILRRASGNSNATTGGDDNKPAGMAKKRRLSENSVIPSFIPRQNASPANNKPQQMELLQRSAGANARMPTDLLGPKTGADIAKPKKESALADGRLDKVRSSNSMVAPLKESTFAVEASQQMQVTDGNDLPNPKKKIQRRDGGSLRMSSGSASMHAAAAEVAQWHMHRMSSGSSSRMQSSAPEVAAQQRQMHRLSGNGGNIQDASMAAGGMGQSGRRMSGGSAVMGMANTEGLQQMQIVSASGGDLRGLRRESRGSLRMSSNSASMHAAAAEVAQQHMQMMSNRNSASMQAPIVAEVAQQQMCRMSGGSVNMQDVAMANVAGTGQQVQSISDGGAMTGTASAEVTQQMQMMGANVINHPGLHRGSFGSHQMNSNGSSMRAAIADVQQQVHRIQQLSSQRLSTAGHGGLSVQAAAAAAAEFDAAAHAMAIGRLQQQQQQRQQPQFMAGVNHQQNFLASYPLDQFQQQQQQQELAVVMGAAAERRRSQRRVSLEGLATQINGRGSLGGSMASAAAQAAAELGIIPGTADT